MINEKFFCRDCHRYFDEPKFYEEKHGLDNPPYQSIPVCSVCGGDDFLKFNSFVEKIDVAEKLLPIIMTLNNLISSLKDIFGNEFRNDNLNFSIETAAEMISEMFEFLDADMQKRILAIDNDSKLNMVLRYIKGEL